MRMILNNETCTLGDLRPGDQAVITELEYTDAPEDYFRRLLEMGFMIGETLEVMNEAPVSRNPLSVKIKDATYALRREEATCIRVKRVRAS